MPDAVPLVLLTAVDPVVRDAATVSLVLGSPGTVAIRHDVVRAGDDGEIRRVVVDATGVVEDVVVPLEHTCLGCAVREDAVPTLRRLAADGRWGSVVLGLPTSAESLPVTRALVPEARPGGDLAALRLAAVVAVLDGATFEQDLLGDDLLAERGTSLGEHDRRAVGEALAAQVAHADVVVVDGDAPPVASDLLDHVRAADGVRVDGLHGMDPRRLLTHHHDPVAGEARTDPRRAHARPGPTGNGVWTLDLRSERPIHPDRLLDRVRDLGGGRTRSRGVFWVPTRPYSACAWDGSGGQLSIGEAGPWGLLPPRTHLVVTGVGDEGPEVRRAFHDVLLTADEWHSGLASWLGRPDALAPWLGERDLA